MKKLKNIKVSKTVLEGCLEAGVNPVVSLLKIAKKPNINLNLKIKVLQGLLPYLYKDTEAMDEYNDDQLYQNEHVTKLLNQLTVDDLKALANNGCKETCSLNK